MATRKHDVGGNDEDAHDGGADSTLRAMARAAELSRPPHFIIVGAQKSGTSTLHGVLGAHPDVFIPSREIFFFDIDDDVQHPDFGPVGGGVRDFDADFETYAAWYGRFFERAQPGQRRGEDSTSYLASTVAPERIGRLCPDVKVIALLRDPVSRAYSHYWHDVSRGRCSRSFTEVIDEPDTLVVQRGFYRDQVQRYHDALGSERVKVLVFEEFSRNLDRVCAEVCDFLGLSPPPASALERERYNVARVPRNLEARLWINRNLPMLVKKSYRGLLPEPSAGEGLLASAWRDRLWNSSAARVANRVLDAARPQRKYPPMPEPTRKRLTQTYREANAGLERLLGRDDLGRWWESWG